MLINRPCFDRLVGVAVLSALAVGDAPARTWQTFHEDHVLGTSLDVGMAGNADATPRALEAAREEIARLDAIFSGWRDDSELTALNQSASFRASPDLFQVVSDAEYVRQL